MTDAALPVALLHLDSTHHVTAANDECVRVLGRAGDDLLGHPLWDLLPVAARFFFQTHVFPALDAGGRSDELYLSLRGPAGEPLPVVMNVARSGPAPARADVLAFLPMHRRHLHERELIHARLDAQLARSGQSEAVARAEEARARLAVAERLASIGELAAGVAHEINNPLAYVWANLELLGADPAAAARRADYPAIVAELREGVARIREVVASLKTLSRVDESRRSPVDLDQAVDSALRIAGADVRHKALVELDLERPAPAVLADEGRLGQVLINLLINAAQALPAERRADNRITVRVRRLEGDRCEIVVGDNGVGIPADLLPRIFDPFFTTKPVGEGTGLGLSVCHGIVTSLGGTISVESQAQRGATFRIVLPALPPAAAAPPAPPPVRAVEVPQPRRRVLLIEDEEAVAKVVARALPACDVTWLSDGRQAWERFQADGLADFEVVLSDLTMPGMGGMELYERVGRVAPEVAARMVFFTGGAFTADLRDFLDGITAPVLAKPFNLVELRRVVAAVGTHRAAG